MTEPLGPTPDLGGPDALGSAAAPTASGLARAARSGVIWSGGSRLLGQVIQFAASIVLARLLTPADFGLVGIVYVFAGVASLLKDAGIGTAIVRKPDLRPEDLATGFWINALVGVGFTVLIGLSGPLVAGLFDAPELANLMLLVGITFTLSLHVVPLALLERQLRFKAAAMVELAVVLIGSGCAVAAGFAGLGYYALVVSPVVQAALLSVAFLLITRFRPAGFIDRRAARELWAFSGAYTAANLLTYARTNADPLLVGKVLGQTQLGYYGRSSQAVTLPLQQITHALHRVMLPTFARLRDEQPLQLRQAYLRAVGLIAVAAGLAMGGLAAVADTLVPLLWGGQWLPMVPIVQWLAAAGALLVVGWPTSWLCEVEGRTDRLFQLSVVSAVVTIAISFAAVRYGVVAVSAGLAVSTAIGLIPNVMVAGRLVHVPTWEIVRCLLPGLGGGVAAALVTIEVGQLISGDAPLFARLLLQGTLAAVLALAAMALLDRMLGTRLLQPARELLRR